MAAIAVTTLSSALNPRRTWNGGKGLASSFSPKQ
jgi:hypothetical protein